MEQRLIDANALKRYIDDAEFCIKCQKKKLCCDIDCPFPDGLTKEWERAINEQPTVDAVPVDAVEQIRWERDIAMQQLQEHGIPFGGKADDVVNVCRCKDCQWFDANDDYYDSYCDKNGISVEEDFYCADGERRTE